MENIKILTSLSAPQVITADLPLSINSLNTRGFDTSGKIPFQMIGRNGINISEKYKPYPRTYLAVAVDGFPNWFQALGPSSAVGAGTQLLVMERQVEYAVAATLKLQRERLKSMEVKARAVQDFDEYLEVSRSRT
jgi:cation diffusion facilitator CzcD-associated flavoprotein CzcO